MGSGSTASFAVEAIGRRLESGELNDVVGIPTSTRTADLAQAVGIRLTTLNDHPVIDLTIDGADEVDPAGNLIKGGGGALTREKIVAFAAKQLAIVSDETKLVEKLGTNHPIPIEVLPFAIQTVVVKMEELGGKPVLREGKRKAGPVVTDNGNFIVDVDFGPLNVPKKLDSQLKSIPGVIETGLFVEMADVVYVGTSTTVEKLERK